jgi:hypothetical protein
MTAVRRASLFAAFFMLVATSGAFAADGDAWKVTESSGDVWLSSTGTQPASLTQNETLKPGDTVRTGRSGRVLLRRGEETILISPNSVMGLPPAAKDGLVTTILQQAGSILLEVEKRNVKHFEVETPYLAAVVKGTQFRVTVGAASTTVDVVRGQVEVNDFRSGQIAQVMPGQHAITSVQGKAGLSLSGSGSFHPIEQGKPRASTIERVPVPKAGFSAPRNAAIGQTQHNASLTPARPVTRLSASIGEVRLNFNKVTHGLARDNSLVSGPTRNAPNKDTIWSSSNSGTTATGASNQSTTNNGASGSGSATSNASAASASSVATSVAGVASSGGSNGVNGNGNGKGNGNGNGNNGNGHGNGNGNNGNGNGNGNGNNGNGNGNGHGH